MTMRGTRRTRKTTLWSRVSKYLLQIGICALAGLVLLDLAVKHYRYFAVDGTFGFAAWFGTLATFALVLLALAVSSLVRAPEETYDD